MPDKVFPVPDEEVVIRNNKAMQLKKVLHDKITEFAKDAGYGFVITFNDCEDVSDMFTCRPCY